MIENRLVKCLFVKQTRTGESDGQEGKGARHVRALRKVHGVRVIHRKPDCKKPAEQVPRSVLCVCLETPIFL